MNVLTPVFRKAKTFFKRFLPGCVVLCYHRVGEDVKDQWGNVVSVDNFRNQMDTISRHFHPISMSDLVATMKSGEWPSKRIVVVTFDDGYVSNVKYACEILLKRKIPATFYVSTYTLEDESYYWWDELQGMLVDNPDLPNSIDMEILTASATISHANENQRKHFFAIIHKALKGMAPIARNTVLSNLMHRSNSPQIDHQERKPLTSEDILDISREPIFDIGGHTHSHCALSLLTWDQQASEIEKNKMKLENIIEKSITHFSYPFGGDDDFEDETIQLVKISGYESAVTTKRKALRLDDDLYRIPRMSVKNWDALHLRNNITELFRD